MEDEESIMISPPDASLPGIHVETTGTLSNILSKMLRNNPEWVIEDPIGIQSQLMFRVRHAKTGFVKNLYYESTDGEHYTFADIEPQFYLEP